MKRFITVLGIVTIICVIIGTYIHIGGFFMNGLKLFDNPIFSFGPKEQQVSFNEDYEDVEKLDINMAIGDVVIKQGSSFNVDFKGHEDLKPEVTLKDGKLSVKQKKNVKIKSVNLGNYKSDLTVTVPSGVKLTDLEADLDMGDLNISDVSCKKLDADLAMGNLEIKNVEAEKIFADNDMGDCKIYDSEFEDLTADCDMGNVKVKLTDSVDNYGISAKCDMGNVSIDGDKEGNNYSSRGDKNITLKVAMGNIDVD